ncbi:FAD-binding protein [Amycolatopsis acidicola]|uniref:FAD-binding protein n=1 Tax=Amycolatopsis acidicola TaxID=2596893 RepID=A0A5N0USI0_9PSEU|nr:FAD-binding protein [Amycolatopsis acidicola]KAA9152757.1 FAD-binding protein [Amycolatopsis acidicola]
MTTTPWADPELLTTDVAVIGSGGAGLMCVLHALEADPSLHVTIVSKGAVGRSGCTRMVQGGYNAVLDPNDSIDAHFSDTLAGGKYLNNQELAWTLVNDAPRVIHELETRVGCFFDRRADGRIHQKAFAGQTFDRTVHRGDLTGIEIMGRLRDQMFRLGPVELEDVRALDLIHDADGQLAGITGVHMRTGRPLVLRARVVVVATGGSATMYRVAAPAREKTGDGIAMCWRAGLAMRDMEMLQFHPTGLLAGEARMTGAVLEEGLRGAGAILRNALGERYMESYDPERLERSTRDVVARSGYLEIAAGRGTPEGGVLIDISHLGREEVERRFPGMVARTRQIGQDLASGPVTVSPTAHFHMGGVIIDKDCLTSLQGLLVAGEDAGGVHGANRLGGNGVAESTVYGARAGDTAAGMAPARSLHEPDQGEIDASFRRAYAPLGREEGPSPFELTRRLKELMWNKVGVVRDGEGLVQAAKELDGLAEEVRTVAAPGPAAVNFGWQEAMDLTNQITVARTMAYAAAWRTETRGAHARSDYPDSRQELDYLVLEAGPGDEIHSSVAPVEFTHASPPRLEKSGSDGGKP